jgi:glycosyltransferase involved in cell wall biosynthesis
VDVEDEMNQRKVTVVIPAYNQAEFLGKAIQSVLDQTFADFEIIVVNDASPDHTEVVVKQFDDPRLRYICHEENRGLPAARNTGMRASSGEIIALLDADDLFHPQKLQTHVTYLAQNSDIGVTYNDRFELNHSALTIRDIWCPPQRVSLRDFVLGFPFSPSDMVLRREWAFDVGLFDESYICGGEDVDFPLRLALANCRFANVGLTLNYRRYHTARRRRNLDCRIGDYRRALESAFADPRYPVDERHLRNEAFVSKYLEVAYLALVQEETELGQEFVNQVIRYDPAIIEGNPCRLVQIFMINSIRDHNLNHEVVLQGVFDRLPAKLASLSDQYHWAVARGYLTRGALSLMWDEDDKPGIELLQHAARWGAELDKPFLRFIVDRLVRYESEFGVEAARGSVRVLSRELEKLGNPSQLRWLEGCLLINRAFCDYRAGRHTSVPEKILRAVIKDPVYITNRGILKIFFQSLLSRLLPGNPDA